MLRNNRLALVIGIIVTLCVSLGVLSRVTDSSDSLIGLVGAAILTIFAIRISAKRKGVGKVLLAAFVLRLIMALVFTYVLSDADPDGYGKVASQLMTFGFPGLLAHIPMGAYSYSGIVSTVWSLFGSSYLLIRVMNAFIGFYCCVVFYDIAKNMYRERTTRYILVMMCFFPTLLRFSATFASRETLFLLLFMLAVKQLYKFYAKNKTIDAILSMGLIIVASILHVAAISLSVVLVGIMIRRSNSANGILRLILFVGLIAGLSVFMLQNNIGTEKLNLYSNISGTDRIAAYQNGGATGRAAYLEGLGDGSITSMIVTLPIKVIYFLFTPFVWMVRNPLDVLGYIDTLFYIYLSYCTYRSFRDIRERAEKGEYFQILLLISLLIMLVIFGSVVSNYGTALRHRAKLVMIFAILSGPYIQRRMIARGKYE